MCMKIERILVPESLQETLWRLEEARLGFRAKSVSAVEEALDWVFTRQGLPKAYFGMFEPLSKDLSQGLRLPTGERVLSKVAIRHILSEEALRALIVWKCKSSSALTKAIEGFNDILKAGGKNGSWCCYTCTIAFLRALAVVKPDNSDAILEKGLGKIKKARTKDGKWHGFPYYYTLLALAEMDTSLARAELRYASTTAGRLLIRYEGKDRKSRFRKLALEATLKAA